MLALGTADNLFDVKTLLICNREEYKAEKKKFLTISACPSNLLTCIEGISAAVAESKARPGLNTVITCCVTHGLPLIQKDSRVTKFKLSRASMYKLQHSNVDYFDIVASFYRTLKISLGDPGMGGMVKRSLTIPEDLAISLSNTSADIGINSQTLCILSCMIILIQQTTTVRGHKEQMDKTLRRFFRSLIVKTVVGNALISAVENLPDIEL